MNQIRGYYTGNEFVKTIDYAELLNANEGKTFCLKFEMKTKKDGEVIVYLHNGDSKRYEFATTVESTTMYTQYELFLTPELVNESVNEAYLSFYGGHGSGVIPTVKNINIEVVN